MTLLGLFRKKYRNLKKINENILILILEIFYDFACEERKDFSSYLFGYQ